MANKKDSTKNLLVSIQIAWDSVTRFGNHVDAVINKQTTEDQEINSLKIRLSAITPKLDEVTECYAQLIANNVIPQVSLEEFEDLYFTAIAKASTLLDSVRTTPTVQSHSSRSVKLPPITVPLFSGDIHGFHSFFDTFLAVVDTNEDLSEVEKLFYLKQSLRGSAAECVSGMQMTQANYKIAISNLKSRYDNRKLQVLSHLETLFNFPKIQRENATDLRQLSDLVERHFRGLDNLRVSESEFKNAILAYIIKSKSDFRTASDFIKLQSSQIPSLEESKSFLNDKCLTLESLTYMTNKHSDSNSKAVNKSLISKQSFQSSVPSNCPICSKGVHSPSHCPVFLEITPKLRYERAKEANLCLNCLKHSNSLKCRSTNTCRNCSRKHNTLLCFSNPTLRSQSYNVTSNTSNDSVPSNANESHSVLTQPQSSEIQPISQQTQQSTICSNTQTQNSGTVLLSTAKIIVVAGTQSVQARCLLDSASQSNFITKALCDSLHLKSWPSRTVISGVNGSRSESIGICSVKLQSCYSNFSCDIKCLVVPSVTSHLPTVTLNKNLIPIPVNIQLADDTYYESSSVDLLIGADTFYDLMLPGQVRLGKGLPVLQNTTFGYVVSGKIPATLSSHPTISHASVVQSFHLTNHSDSDIELSLSDSIKRFLTVDDVNPVSKSSLLSKEQKFCEENFQNTTRTNPNGTLVLTIPFKINITQLGYSKTYALNRLLNLEKRFQKDPFLKSQYVDFMREYQDLGHMSEIGSLNNIDLIDSHGISAPIICYGGTINVKSIPRYYLPHHPVFKANSLTTKIRVVFEGNAKTLAGASLNDSQIVGPIVQDDLFSILLRFRQFEIAVVADIEKMYRTIYVENSQRHLQSILWRDTPQDQIKVFELNTVTYGTASASYMATRSLRFIAERYSTKFPQGSKSILENFYIDDWLVSTNTQEEMILLKSQVSHCLSNHGLILRKFVSNKADVLLDPSQSNHKNDLHTVTINDKSISKTLGLNWMPAEDILFCDADLSTAKVTKRTMLSAIAKIYDPLGILAPIVVVAKLIMQKLWHEKVDWDDPVSDSIRSQWHTLQQQWIQTSPPTIQRFVIPTGSNNIQLHGFSDASSRAYGACVYVRSVQANMEISCHLLCAKSKVAPMHSVSIPRLELCAAVLLSQLIQKVTDSLSIKPDGIYLWTDSTIVIHWIHSTPNVHKVFVANRIAVIHELSNITWWRHVPSSFNAADLISRGSSVPDLKSNTLWWQGPEFLRSFETSWPVQQVTSRSGTEQFELKQCLVVTKVNPTTIFSRYSTFSKLQRVYAYVIRFFVNVRVRIRGDPDNGHAKWLSVNELRNSLNSLIKLCQSESFSEELRLLRSDSSVNLKSSLKLLNVFIDTNGCLRVGGRLANSDFDYNKKHPIVLPKGHKFTVLILEHYHKILLHCGAQHLLASVRERFWPIDGKNQCKLVIRRCIVCARARPAVQHPIMGDLPRERLTFTHPFNNVGVDFAGPILIKEKKVRNTKFVKAYICLFICLSVRAVHLELVTDLSTDSFVAAFRRFIARRGKPAIVWSDNAKNFVGGASKIRELQKAFNSNKVQISNFLVSQDVTWKFITPRSPHEGGIWEAAIKSTKFHLRRVLKDSHLDYESLLTVLTQIESVLNSRPLSLLSSDPDDLTPLTPNHFLLGRSLLTLPEVDMSNSNPNRLQLYQRAQHLQQCFWKRWQREVVPELQRRCKWFKRLPELAKINSVVTLQEDGIQPLRWKIGRIIELHRSNDGIVRAATVRLPGGSVVRRSMHKMCVLPVNE